LGGNGASIPSVCELGVINGASLQTQLNLVGFSQAQIDALILCLVQAGTTVTPIEF
jgi:hypothetical protein